MATLSRDFLLNRGRCCGSGCTNCPYGVRQVDWKQFKDALPTVSKPFLLYWNGEAVKCKMRDDGLVIMAGQCLSYDPTDYWTYIYLPNGTTE